MGDFLVQVLDEPPDEANVFPASGQSSGDDLIHLGVDGIGGAQGLSDSAGSGMGIVKARPATAGDEICHLIIGHLPDHSHAELGQ